MNCVTLLSVFTFYFFSVYVNSQCSKMYMDHTTPRFFLFGKLDGTFNSKLFVKAFFNVPQRIECLIEYNKLSSITHTCPHSPKLFPPKIAFNVTGCRYVYIHRYIHIYTEG